MSDYESLVKTLRDYASRINELSRGLFRVREADIFAQAADAIEELSDYVEQYQGLLHRSVTFAQILMDRLSPDQKVLPEPEIRIRLSELRKLIGLEEWET